MTTLTDKTPISDVRWAWRIAMSVARREASELVTRATKLRMGQIEVLACDENFRVRDGELDFIDTAGEITPESVAKWAAEARRLGATRLSRFDVVNKLDEDDYDPTDVWAVVELRLA